MATSKKLKSDAFAAIHESATAMQKVGAIDKATMRGFDKSCLAPALAQSQADIAAGRYVVESAQQHMERVEAMLAADGGGVPAKKAVLGKIPVKKTATRKAARRSPGK